MKIKILGTGCPSCQSMYNDVNRILARKGWQGVDVEYVKDIGRILSYGVMTMPVLVVDEKIAMLGNGGAKKIEAALQAAVDSEE